MSQQPSYCLDVFLGRSADIEHYRHELLSFLQETRTRFSITTVQLGRMGEEKSLRILTPNADGLYKHLYDSLDTGDDNDYEVHHTEIDARRSMRFMPDYGHPIGYEEFDINDWKAPDVTDFSQAQQLTSRAVTGTHQDFDDSIY